MSFFSSWSKAIFIISLAFPLYSETAFLHGLEHHERPDCRRASSVCRGESEPICGTNGKTYVNKCDFCTHKLQHPSTFGFEHYGEC